MDAQLIRSRRALPRPLIIELTVRLSVAACQTHPRSIPDDQKQISMFIENEEELHFDNEQFTIELGKNKVRYIIILHKS